MPLLRLITIHSFIYIFISRCLYSMRHSHGKMQRCHFRSKSNRHITLLSFIIESRNYYIQPLLIVKAGWRQRHKALFVLSYYIHEMMEPIILIYQGPAQNILQRLSLKLLLFDTAMAYFIPTRLEKVTAFYLSRYHDGFHCLSAYFSLMLIFTVWLDSAWFCHIFNI